MDISAILLAGGESSRFGSDKAFHKLEDQSFLQKTLEAISKVANQVIISVDTIEKAERVKLEVQNPNVELHIDKIRGGPAVSIKECVQEAIYDRIIVLPVDIPYVTEEDISQLVDVLDDSEFSIYRIRDNFTMLFFGTWKKVISRVNNPFRVREFLRKAKSCIIYNLSEYGTLININTPELIPSTKPERVKNISKERIHIPSFQEGCTGIIEEYDFWRNYGDMRRTLRRHYSECF